MDVNFPCRYPLLFATDEAVGKRTFFSFVSYFVTTFGRWYNGFSVIGEEHVPREGAALLVGLHTTHNVEIATFIFEGQRRTGRVVRQLLHRTVKPVYLLSNYFGGVMGSQEVAVDLLKVTIIESHLGL